MIRSALVIFIISLVIACGNNSYYQGKSTGLGKTISENQIQAWNIDISPTGAGLPPGSGTAKSGEKLYQQKCASCHGDKGQGGPANRLVGGGGLNTNTPIKTVGSFWPYSTTIFDYVRRAMPHQAPQSLSNTQVYEATAYILYMNQIITKDEVIDAHSLPLVRMPNRSGFISAEN
ncbi:c-type cytochrome [Polynucleobacter brandtiae]